MSVVATPAPYGREVFGCLLVPVVLVCSFFVIGALVAADPVPMLVLLAVFVVAAVPMFRRS